MQNHCTIFKAKTNRPLTTFKVGNESEEVIKVVCITKNYIGDEKRREMSKLIEEGKTEGEEYNKLIADFDKQFRVLVTTK